MVTPALLSLEGAFYLETDEDGNWLNGQGQMADQDMAADLTTAVQYLTINRLVDWTGETTLENPLTLTLQDQDGSQIQLLVGQLTQEEDERLIAQADEPQLIYAAPADELEPVLAATDQSLLADQETARMKPPKMKPPVRKPPGRRNPTPRTGQGARRHPIRMKPPALRRRRKAGLPRKNRSAGRRLGIGWVPSEKRLRRALGSVWKRGCRTHRPVACGFDTPLLAP